jgi:sulfur-carrier protein adenylyltransferase/sulfurtransferase
LAVLCERGIAEKPWMRLTEAQQDRYSRHLLLEGLGGEGQERLVSSCVRVRGTGRCARWAARYLAASGIGILVLDDPAAAAECRELSPDTRVADASASTPRPDVELDLSRDSTPGGQSAAERGALAALAALRQLVRP